jgi:hypothetical protein
MSQITRNIDAGNLTAIGLAHTQPVHLVRLTTEPNTPGETAYYYLSEGPDITFNSDPYIGSSVRVGPLSWTGEGDQTCTVEILNDGGLAQTLFFDVAALADSLVDIWLTYVDSLGANSTPTYYIAGGIAGSSLSPESLKLIVVTMKARTAYAPNSYMEAAGFTHIPPDGAVVIWNEGTYILERSNG